MTAASSHDLEGRFPFGRPSRRCEPRRAADARALILGVYPSALHVRWTGPGVSITALAVDEEPWPFWDGADQEQRVNAWREQVNWQPEWGTATPVSQLNGSSGQKLSEHYLRPLGLDLSQVWLTDCLPFFHVWRAAGSQGAAMSERYDPFAATHPPLQPHELPARPSNAELIARTVHEEGDRLRQEITESGASLVITLGNEPLHVIRRLLDADLPRSLHADGYGTSYDAQLRGTPLRVLPLCHPRHLYSAASTAAWNQTHRSWAASQAGPTLSQA